jgi:hypothetical protein
VVFRLWQCDIENNCGREGTAPAGTGEVQGKFQIRLLSKISAAQEETLTLLRRLTSPDLFEGITWQNAVTPLRLNA